MEHENGDSEHAKLQNDVSPSSTIDDESLDNDQIVGSSSSLTSPTYSNNFEVDIGEEDTNFLEFEENDSTSVVLNPESPTMISTLPQTCDLDAVYGCLKQSPPVQVMGQPTGYSLNQMPSPSGELNWIDDHACFTPDASKSCMSPGLPTVMDTSSEIERKSASISSESGEPIHFEMEKGKSFANPANICRLSDASCQSTSSFAFPILAGGSPSPTKVEAEKMPPTPTSTPPAEVAQLHLNLPHNPKSWLQPMVPLLLMFPHVLLMFHQCHLSTRRHKFWSQCPPIVRPLLQREAKIVSIPVFGHLQYLESKS
ncbi:hypothetical protein E3N88_12519 [Mikania micrantha]|uniref:Uncharacterized protein n=1 Tax=Mikania micrantha TaxID=192012 RepID=A0A5N6P5X5_9ASTR|nr:hypothetical protein E3N88_12519 [Mikania micrantha]